MRHFPLTAYLIPLTLLHTAHRSPLTAQRHDPLHYHNSLTLSATDTVQPAVVATAEVRGWLDAPERAGAPEAMVEKVLDAMLSTMVSEPVGHRGTLRILELRRAGVERSLASAALELGSDDGLALVRALRQEGTAIDVTDDEWAAEWQRVGAELERMGFVLPPCGVPSVGPVAVDRFGRITPVTLVAGISDGGVPDAAVVTPAPADGGVSVPRTRDAALP